MNTNVAQVNASEGRAINSKAMRRAAAWCLVIVLIAVPLLTKSSPFLLLLATTAAIAGIVALSLDLLTGTVGLIAFGHAAWYGMGAYIAGLAAKYVSAELLVTLPLTIVAAAIGSALVGWIFVRQVGKTFAILTLALSQVMFSAVFVFSAFTGGEDGLQEIPTARLAGHPLNSASEFYWLVLFVLGVAVLLAFKLRESPLGRACLAVRDNPERARFIGLNVNRLKLFAYVSSAVLAAVAGALYGLSNNAVSPDVLHWVESGKILMYVVLGGVGTIVGPVAGAAAFTIAEHYISSWSDAWQIYFGAAFVLVVILAPGGLFGAARTLIQRHSKSEGE